MRYDLCDAADEQRMLYSRLVRLKLTRCTRKRGKSKIIWTVG